MQASSPSQVAGNGALIRCGGLSILLALSIHIYVNGALKQFPPEAPTPEELAVYLSSEASTWAIVHGLKYLALAGLVVFAAGAFARTGLSRAQAGAGWGIIGLLGTSIHVSNALIANGIEVAAFYDFSKLSQESSLFWLLFYTVRVLFTAEIVAWGLTIFGFSMAGMTAAMLPRWIVGLGFVSSASCLLAGVFVVSVLNGGWAVILMDIASFGGLAWFASVGGFLLLRGASGMQSSG